MGKANRDAASVVGTVSSGRIVAGVLAPAERNAKARHEKDVRDKTIELQSQIFSHAAAYDNGVIVAGYVAFFALWAGSNKDVSHLCRLVTVASMGVSLLCYMGWHILQMLTRQTFEFKLAKVLKVASDPERFNREWAQTKQERDIALMRILRFWPWLFVPAVGFGFLAGVILSYNALAVILGWPQLAG